MLVGVNVFVGVTVAVGVGVGVGHTCKEVHIVQLA